MKQHFAAIAAALSLIMAAFFVIKLAQGDLSSALILAFASFCLAVSACSWYFNGRRQP